MKANLINKPVTSFSPLQEIKNQIAELEEVSNPSDAQLAAIDSAVEALACAEGRAESLKFAIEWMTESKPKATP